MSKFFPRVQRDDYSIKNMIPFYHLGSQYLDLIENFPDANIILVIGIGDGLLPSVLRSKGFDVETIDIDSALQPTYRCNVTDLKQIKRKYDVVICSNVLEHLPFEFFQKALSEIKRVAKQGLILTLPYAGIVVGSTLNVDPLMTPKKLQIKIPLFAFKRHKFDGQHYWEIGTRGYSFTFIKRQLEEQFELKKSYMGNDWEYCHHFILMIPRVGRDIRSLSGRRKGNPRE
jgi:SAM-dependent methyltransferase